MTYITYRRWKPEHGDTLSGRITIPYGTELSASTDNAQALLCLQDGRPVCVARSDNGIKHFARNDDGRGLERGKLTYAIAHAPRGKGVRFTDEERAVLATEYSRWLVPGIDVILFNDDFYRADVDALAAMAKRFGITPRKGR